MKARALVLMLSICMIGSTGFGFTTTDLTKNSTDHEIAVGDIVIDVVTIPVLSLELDHDLAKGDENRFVQKFAEADRAFNVEFKNELDVFKPDKLDNTRYKVKKKRTQNTYRRARDGLNCK